jgi:16S rRNA (guanine527-N7)-methyltransferase
MMSANNTQLKEFKETLALAAPSYKVSISVEVIDGLGQYYDLLNTWNAQLHLVAPCSPREFAKRHVLESLTLLSHLPPTARVADIGSGAGLPIIPCLIAHPDITVTLIESAKKKAVFLREAISRTGSSQSATVIAERFEDISTPDVDYITCRALDRFEAKLPALLKWSPPASTLLFFGGEGLGEQMTHMNLGFSEIKIPNSERRFLFVIRGEAWQPIVS